MDLEVEGEVAGFLGAHIERDQEAHSITLTQTGLIDCIIEAAVATHLPIKHTPASAIPLVEDNDGDPVNDTFKYSSVVGISRDIHARILPTL
jgi:hypothetical protein